MDGINQILEALSGWLWGWPMIILLLGTHIYLTIILRFPQRKIFTAIRLSVKRDPNASGDVSQFRSLATALAATIGTGNIIGVATAVALGGPGAVLWCWLTGVFGCDPHSHHQTGMESFLSMYFIMLSLCSSDDIRSAKSDGFITSKHCAQPLLIALFQFEPDNQSMAACLSFRMM